MSPRSFRAPKGPDFKKASCVEQLEGRTLFSTYVVDTVVDENDGIGAGGISLRDAIEAANLNSGGDTITFDATVFNGGGTIALGGTELQISDDLVIAGDIGQTITIDAGGNSRVLNIGSHDVTLDHLNITGGQIEGFGGGVYADQATLTISNSTITGNNADENGAFASGSGSGGGIQTKGSLVTIENTTISGNTSEYAGAGLHASDSSTLTVRNSTISGNTSGGAGGGVHISETSQATLVESSVSGNAAGRGDGGGVYVSFYANVSIISSTLSGNEAQGGGGITAYFSTLSITNSTVSGNEATIGRGGGVYTWNGTVLEINNSTITGNTAARYGGGLHVSNSSYTAGDHSYTVNNSIIAGNTSTSAYANDVYAYDNPLLGGHNLIGRPDDGFGLVDGVDGNIVGDGALTIDINSVLDTTLADNGGPTLTHRLIEGGAAIDAGNQTLLPLDTADLDGDLITNEALPFDQVQQARISGTELDIGAVEAADELTLELSFDGDQIFENAINGTEVGQVAVDPSGVYTHVLTDDADGRFAIDSETGVVTVLDASLLDAELATSHDITVEVTNPDLVTASATFTIQIAGANGTINGIVPRIIEPGNTYRGFLRVKVSNNSSIDFTKDGTLTVNVFARSLDGTQEVILSQRVFNKNWKQGKVRTFNMRLYHPGLAEGSYQIVAQVSYEHDALPETVSLHACGDRFGHGLRLDVTDDTHQDLVGCISSIKRSVVAGSDQKMPLLIKIENHGSDRLQAGTIDLQVFVEDTDGNRIADPVATLNDVKIKKVVPGGRFWLKTKIDLPSGLAPGEYQFVVALDSSDEITESNPSGTGESNNESRSDRFTVSQPQVDLSVQLKHGDIGNYSTDTPISERLRVRIQNQGNIPTAAGALIYFNINVFDSADALVGSQLIESRNVGKLKVNGSIHQKLLFQHPGLAAGDYRAVVTLVSVNFTDESANNSFEIEFNVV